MKFISHRGNIKEKTLSEENSPEKILYCLSLGYDVEIDVRYENNEYHLGHDYPQYKINRDFLLNKGLWCHAKDLNSLHNMLELGIVNCFWHQEDRFTITTKGYIWTYPGYRLTEKSVCVLPETVNYDIEDLKKCYGICSDNIENYRRILCN